MKSKLFKILLALSMVLSMSFVLKINNTKVYADDVQYLTFTAEESGAAISFDWVKGSDVMIKTNDETEWTAYDAATTITLENAGDYVQFKGQSVCTDYSFHFDIQNGKIAASGDVTSLTNGLGGDCELSESCYEYMFRNCSDLTQAPDLPSTVLSESCYYGMFYGCSSLIEAPELPAQKMAEGCYEGMFYECTGLTKAPELPAAQLAESCYNDMFGGCTSLESAPQLPATELAEECYQMMFSNCESLTDVPDLSVIKTAKSSCYKMFENCISLEKAPELPATEVADYCYYSMFENCTNLITSPTILPATTLARECYRYMFTGCANLESFPELPATELAEGCYYEMFSGCSTLEGGPELPAVKLTDYCYYCMFEGCSNLVFAPELPATSLAESCYMGMFYQCYSLLEAPELPATKLADECYYMMFSDCKTLTDIPVLPATELTDECYYGMFRGCTNLKISETETEEYVTAWSLPADIDAGLDNCEEMFLETGGTFTGDPEAGKTYYTTNVHEWVLDTDNDGFIAKCIKISSGHANGNCEYASEVKLTVKDPSCVYTGKPVEMIVGTEEERAVWEELGFEIPTVRYTDIWGNELDTLPVDIGEYIAIAETGDLTYICLIRISEDLTHEWSYSLNDDTITATCIKEPPLHTCNLEDGLTLTLTDPSCAYSGYYVYYGVGTSDELEEWEFEGLEVPVVEYYEGDIQLDGAPAEAGDYIARITVNGISRDYLFSITEDEVHEWSYSLSDEAISAVCTKTAADHEKGNCKYASGLTLTVAYPSCEYTGKTVELTVGTTEEQSVWVAAGLELPAIEYYEGDTQLDGAPVEAGNYIARITVNGISRDYPFSITEDEVHEWSYSFSDEAISAVCNKTAISHEKGNCKYASGLTLTVADPSCEYTGKTVELIVGTTEEQSAWVAAGLELPAVKYYKGRTILKSAPVEAGKYTAVVSLNDLSYNYEITISKAEYTGTTTYNVSIFTGSKGTVTLEELPEGWYYGTPVYNSPIKSAVMKDNTLNYTFKLNTKAGDYTITIPVLSSDDNLEVSSVTVTVSKKAIISMSKCTVKVSQSETGKLDVVVTDPSGKVVDSSCYTITTTGTIKKGSTVRVRVTGISAQGYSSSKTVSFKVVM